MTRAATVAWLVVLWLVLWRDASLANLLSGLLASVAVTALLPTAVHTSRHRVRPGALAVFAGYFAWKLVESNVVLAREIVTRRDHLQRGIVAVPISVRSDIVATIVANAITLTPGTVTLEVRREPRTLYVHVLHLRDVEAARRSVHRLEHLANRAFPLDDTTDGEDAS